MALTNVPAGTPRPGWRAWEVEILGGQPRLVGLMGFVWGPRRANGRAPGTEGGTSDA